MKKIVKLLLNLIIFTVSFSSYAEELYKVENEQGVYLYYIDVSPSEFVREVAVCNGGDRYVGELIIPDYIAVPDYENESKYVKANVVGIWSNAFYHNDDLTKITLPNKLRYIHPNAFYLCASLTDINFPDGLQDIYNEAFNTCIGLKKIRITAYSVDDRAFTNCTALEEVVFSTNVSNVKMNAFENDKKIKRVILEDGPGEIFFGSTSPYVVGRKAVFSECTLDSVYAGQGYDYDVYPFNGVSKPVLGPQVTVIPPYYFQNDTSEELTIKEGITKIGRYAFSNSNMRTLNVPESLSKIESYAFSGCNYLKELDLSHCSGELQFGDRAFGNCGVLERVSLPEGMKTIGDYVFSQCKMLSNIDIPQSVTIIGREAFRDCTNLKHVNLPQGLKIIGRYSFGRTGLTEIELPEQLDSIGPSAFSQTNLGYIYIPDRINKIENGTFEGCSLLKSVRIPSGVIYIGEGAFQNCIELDSIQIPLGVTTINEKVFAGCSNLKKVVISSDASYDVIGASAFRDCTSLESIELPDNVSIIEDGAFRNCGLVSFKFPNNLRSYQGIGLSVLAECRKLESVKLPDINDKERRLYLYGTFASCSSLSHIDIPECIRGIERGTFSGCDNLKSIVIQEGNDNSSDISISKDGLGIQKLDSLYIGRKVRDAWLLQNGLYGIQFKSITIGDAVTELGARTFPCCKIEKISIGTNVQSIGDSCFYNTIPDTVYCFATSPATMDSSGGLRESLVFVPDETGSLYRSHEAWTKNLIIDRKDAIAKVTMKYAGTLIASMKQQGISTPNNVPKLRIEGNINKADWDVIRNDLPFVYYLDISDISEDSIPSSQFMDNYKMVDIILSDKVKKIGSDAFRGCTHLRDSLFELPSCEFVGDRAFAKSHVSSAIFAKAVHLGKDAFRNSNLSNICFMSSAFIAENTFRDCDALTDVQFNSGSCFIDSAAFYGCSKLKNVSLPNVVENIAPYAFYECRNLRPINFPFNGTNIGSHAFEGCANMESVTLRGKDYTIGKYAFTNSGIRSLIIEDGVSDIGQYAFMGCEHLRGKITLPSSITWVEMGLFKNCSNLDSICLPSNINNIKSEAFSGCTNLKEINLPLSLRTIEASAFYGCDSLANIEIPKWILNMDGAFRNCGLKTLKTHWMIPLPVSSETFEGIDEDNCILKVPANSTVNYMTADNWKIFWKIEEDATDIVNHIQFEDENVKKICVTNWDVDGDNELWEDEVLSVKSIGNIFSNNEDIKSFDELRFFRSMERIESLSFNSCRGLNRIYIPDFIKQIESDAFNGCTSLNSITVSSNNPVFDSRNNSNALILSAQHKLLLGCKNTKIPNTIDIIGDYAFANCIGLDSIKIPDSVKEIGKYAFYECNKLRNIMLPNSLLGAGASSFKGCTTLENVEIGNGLSVISDEMFLGCTSLHSLKIGENISLVGNDAFKGCDSLEIVELGSVNFIEYNSKLASVFGSQVKKYIIGNVITEIPSYAFSACDSLEHVEFSKSISCINECAFEGCISLRSISIPNSVKNIGGACFSGCENLINIALPDGIKTIESRTFYGCKNLQTIEMSDKIDSINYQAFEGCSSLDEIELPSNLSNIGWSAFRNCINLKSIKIPGNVKKIESTAFQGCTNLTNISIPKSVTKIETQAFTTSYKGNIPMDVYIEWEKPTDVDIDNFSGHGFYGLNLSQSTLHVPEGTKTLYKSADVWKDFGKIWEPAIIGDINDDGGIDVGDIAGQVNLIMDMNSDELRYDAADINQDGKIRVDDLTDLLSMILEEEPAYNIKMLKNSENESNEVSDLLQVSSMKECFGITIQNKDMNLTGLQFDLLLSDNIKIKDILLKEDNKSHELLWKKRSNGYYRVILYSMSNQILNALDDDMLTVYIDTDDATASSTLQISNAVATTINANSIKLQNKELNMNGEATVISKIAGIRPNQAYSIFDVTGRFIKKSSNPSELNSLPKGVYIVNGEKIMIK